MAVQILFRVAQLSVAAQAADALRRVGRSIQVHSDPNIPEIPVADDPKDWAREALFKNLKSRRRVAQGAWFPPGQAAPAGSRPADAPPSQTAAPVRQAAPAAAKPLPEPVPVAPVRVTPVQVAPVQVAPAPPRPRTAAPVAGAPAWRAPAGAACPAGNHAPCATRRRDLRFLYNASRAQSLGSSATGISGMFGLECTWMECPTRLSASAAVVATESCAT
jgi:hypothetical protein